MVNYGWNPPPIGVNNPSATVFAIALAPPGKDLVPMGSGFLLNKPGYIVTASHVVGRGGEPVAIVLNDADGIDDYQLAVVTQLRYVPAEIVGFDPIHDLAVLYAPELARYFNPTLVISGSDHIGVGHDVVSFGFPQFANGRKVLTRFDAKIRAKIYLPSPAGNVKYLVLNTLARPGQSGAPVFRAGTNELVAVLSGAYQPPNLGMSIMIAGADLSAMSQTTHIVSAEYLQGMY